MSGIDQLSQVFEDTGGLDHLREAQANLQLKNDYQALKFLRFLLPFEAELMAASK